VRAAILTVLFVASVPALAAGLQEAQDLGPPGVDGDREPLRASHRDGEARRLGSPGAGRSNQQVEPERYCGDEQLHEQEQEEEQR
jgi:hypothetical protein